MAGLPKFGARLFALSRKGGLLYDKQKKKDYHLKVNLNNMKE